MQRLVLVLALAGAAATTEAARAQCDYGFGEAADAAEEAAEEAAAEEAAAITMVTRSVGTVDALSADVSVTAPDTPQGLAAIETIRGLLPAIDDGFTRAGLTWPYWAQVDIQLSGSAGAVWPDGTYTTATTGCLGGRCELQFYGEGWESSDQLAYNLAHEFGHVGQGLRYKRVNNDGTGWWYEGTAEWFANLVVPGLSLSGEWIAEFDRRSQHTSLTDMCYEGVAFFLWAGARFGPTYPFGMGERGESVLEDPRQLAALLSDAEWLDFAETFLSGALRYPDGRPAWPDPIMGPLRAARDGVELRLEGPPLSIPRLRARFRPGEWELDLKGNTPLTSVSEDDTASWFRLRNSSTFATGFTHTSECEEGSRLVLATIGATSTTVLAQVEGEEEPCLEPCDKSIPEDHCMIGAWTALSTDLPDTYNMIAEAIPERARWAYQDMGDNYVVLHADGTYVQAITDAQSEFEYEIDGSIMRQRVFLFSDAHGRWSVVDDQTMIMCADEYEGMMVNEISIEGVTQVGDPFPVPHDPAFVDGDGVRFRYACAGDTADIALRHFGMPRVGWDIRRVPMPPRPEEPF